MSLWRIHASFSETTLKQTTTASIIVLIERQTSIHRDLLSSSDLNVLILEYIAPQRVFVLYSTELRYIDINPIFSHLSASQDIIAAEVDREVRIFASESGDSISTSSLPRTPPIAPAPLTNPQGHYTHASGVPELHHRMPLSLLSARSILPSVSHRVCRCR